MLIRKQGKWWVLLVVGMLFVACNSAKYVPEGEYLLDQVRIKSDNKELKNEEMDEYFRQTPNNAIFGIKSLRMALGIYNLRGKDTTTSFNKMLMRMGEPPVIYSPTLTALSVQQLEKYVHSKGYLLGKVDYKLSIKGKNAKVEYLVKSNKPYTINSYRIDLPTDSLSNASLDTTRSLVQPGALFDTDVLNAERERLSNRFRRRGYYNFNKDFLTFTVDSSSHNQKVDVCLQLKDYIKNSPDTLTKKAFNSYRINKVIYYLSSPATNSQDSVMRNDTIRMKDYFLISPITHPLSLDALVQNTFIDPKARFTDRNVDKTYEALNSIGSIKYVSITFKEHNDSLLNCYINVVLGKFVQTSSEVGATYSATTATNPRAIGGAASLSFIHRNAFKGSESLSLNLKASAEKMDIWAQEYGGQVALRIPKFVFPIGSYEAKRKLHASTEFNYGLKYQFRPTQFETTIMNGGVQYSWVERYYRHTFQLINLNYIIYPQIDTTFEKVYLKPFYNVETKQIEPSRFNPTNFENVFIMSMGYFGSYTNAVTSRPLQSFTNTRYSVDFAGNSLYGLSTLLGFPQDSMGVYRLLGVRYSQYIKADLNLTHHSIIDKNNRIVSHVGLGVVSPFANADIVPFQKRFYSGGANSIRGWAEGTLGPGTYKRFNGKNRDFNQVGDLKFELNVEYRAKISGVFEGAAFIDAGNVWTIKDYDTQAGGTFHINSFISEIAIAYGLGVRCDFSFFILRTDVGVKLRDPVLPPENRWRFSPTYHQDVAFQIAIGYPF